MNVRGHRWKILVIFAALTTSLPAQSVKQSIAVLPLGCGVTVSKEEANTLTQLLETGIVQSGSLQVVERRQIAAVLEEQRFSAEDFSDDSVAAEEQYGGTEPEVLSQYGSLTVAERLLNGLVVVSASGAFVALNGYLNAPHTDVGLQWKRASVALGITAGVLLAVRTFVGLESPEAE